MSKHGLSPIFHGQVSGGQLKLVRREDFARWVTLYEGKRIELVLREHKSKRSLPQNSYYWGVVVALLAEDCGYDPEEMHEALKWKFLQRHDVPLPTVRSTASLNTAEFTAYIEQCRRLGAEMGVVIPSPNEADWVA